MRCRVDEGKRGRTNRSHDAAVVAEHGEHRLLHGRAGHRLREDVLHDRLLPGEHVRLQDVVDRRAQVEDIRARARAPMHVEGVAWGG